MDKHEERQLAARAVELGNSGIASAIPELLELVKSPVFHVRRLSLSSFGKLAKVANPVPIIPVLRENLQNSHAQVRQYAIKALSAYGLASREALHDLNDIADNPMEKEYNRKDAKKAINLIEEALRIKEIQAVHNCNKCGVQVDPDEYARSQKAFQRSYCDKCFDEVYLKRRNFDTQVELNKTIRTKDGTLVQSDGERKIAEWLSINNIVYRYDERFRIIDGMAVRPDFYLPEFDLYIEYWGMDTADYKIGMLKKQKLYQQEGKKLLSLYFSDKPNLEKILYQKLSGYVKLKTET